MAQRDKEKATESSYESASARSTDTADSVRQTHQEQKSSGRILNPLVDPSSYGGLRISKTRFDDAPGNLFRLVHGIAMCISTYVDGSSSFGHTLIQQTIAGLKKTFEVCSKSMPEYELWLLSGVFNDLEEMNSHSSYFTLYRSQFEYDPEKIVNQLLSCVANDGGCGNGGEDPQYAVFAEAFLTNKSISNYGLKSYAFFVSDEPMHDTYSVSALKKIFGEEVFETIKANGHENINEHQLPTVEKTVQEMLKTTHAFYIGLGEDYTRDRHGRTAIECWTEMFGKDRVVPLYGMPGEIMPFVQGAITGLTEGTLDMVNVSKYLGEVGVDRLDSSRIVKAIANIPVRAQAVLLGQLPRRLPKADDLFKSKSDLWPIDPSEMTDETNPNKIDWL